MAVVTLRYWAAAREAAGVAEEKVTADTLDAALAAGLEALRVRSRASEPGSAADPAARLRLVLARSSFLIDGDPAGRRPRDTIRLADAAVVEVLPPFAGG